MKTEAENRAALVQAAEGWLGAKWHDRARVAPSSRSRGLIDCGQLLIAVYQAAGLVGEVLTPAYTRRWTLHQTDETFIQIVEQFAHQTNNPQPGDVVLWKIGHIYSHAGIVTKWPEFIHAEVHQGVVRDSVATNPMLNAAPQLFYTVF